MDPPSVVGTVHFLFSITVPLADPVEGQEMTEELIAKISWCLINSDFMFFVLGRAISTKRKQWNPMRVR